MKNPVGGHCPSRLLLSLAAIALSGCGSRDPYAVKTVSADGSVTYQGKTP